MVIVKLSYDLETTDDDDGFNGIWFDILIDSASKPAKVRYFDKTTYDHSPRVNSKMAKSKVTCSFIILFVLDR